MPLQAQPARGNVTGTKHLPNNAQETLGLQILLSLLDTPCCRHFPGIRYRVRLLKVASSPPSAEPTLSRGGPALLPELCYCCGVAQGSRRALLLLKLLQTWEEGTSCWVPVRVPHWSIPAAEGKGLLNTKAEESPCSPGQGLSQQSAQQI